MRVALYDRRLPGARLDGDVVVVPPGVRAAADAEALRAFARAGGRLLALGDGVGLLCEAGLLPGAVSAAPGAASVTHVRVEGRATPFTWAIPAGRILALEAARDHVYVAPDDQVAALVGAGRVVMSFCDSSGGLGRPEAGAHASRVAGLCDESGRVVGVLGGLTEALSCALGRQIASCLQRARPSL